MRASALRNTAPSHHGRDLLVKVAAAAIGLAGLMWTTVVWLHAAG
jgi:hypothetical protein